MENTANGTTPPYFPASKAKTIAQLNAEYEPVRIGCEVNIDGIFISPVLSLEVTQKIGEHNKLTFSFHHGVIQTEGSFILDDAADLFGKVTEVIINNKNNPHYGGEFTDKFVITEVSLDNKALSEGILTVTALSPTHLLDGAPHYESYLDRNLADIVQKVCRPMESVKGWQKISPVFTGCLPYVCRFNESAWNFLKRLASALGEWLYFDGTHMVFGRPGEGKALELVYGGNCHQARMVMVSIPLQSSLFNYDPSSDQQMEQAAGADDGNTGSYAQQKAFKRSQELFSNWQTAAAPQSLPVDKSSFDAAARTRSKSTAAGMYTVIGASNNYLLSVGMPVRLSYLRPGKIDGEHGMLRIISVKHTLTTAGAYENTFEAIPVDSAPPFLHYQQPATHQMEAIVLDNADPLGQGRVKVRFMGWQQEYAQETDWIRVLTTDAGMGNAGNNRGHVFIPEKGDQVMVGFMNNNPDSPVVTGALFNGKTGEGGGTDNHLKTITTRSGHTIAFDDAQGNESIVIMDGKKRNIIKFDTEKEKLYITASGDIEMEAENINMRARNNITIKATNAIEATAEKKDIVLQAEKMVKIDSLNSNIELTAKATTSMDSNALNIKTKGDTNIKASGNMTAESSGKVSVKGTETTIAGTAHKLKVN